MRRACAIRSVAGRRCARSAVRRSRWRGAGAVGSSSSSTKGYVKITISPTPAPTPNPQFNAIEDLGGCSSMDRRCPATRRSLTRTLAGGVARWRSRCRRARLALLNGIITRGGQATGCCGAYWLPAGTALWIWLLSRAGDHIFYQDKTCGRSSTTAFNGINFTAFRSIAGRTSGKADAGIPCSTTTSPLDFRHAANGQRMDRILFQPYRTDHTLVLADDPNSHNTA